ncbi:MAG: cob(I)alamin adenosyltransferase [Paraglaciecola sp.]|jgi:cob(I)alamin adenosyltransferase
MKIYTKTGDKGQTQIYTDQAIRMTKDAPVVECYGTLDEVNAHLGLLASLLSPAEQSQLALLATIQQRLFQIGFAISATTTLAEADVYTLEQSIDTMVAQIPAQTTFILPGGCQAAAQAHVARTVTRRAERTMVALLNDYPVPELCLQYLNRLSDYLFVFARWLNYQQGVAETKV